MSTAGFSKHRIARLHDVLAGHVEGGALPGLVSGVVRGDDVHIDAIGTMAFGDAAPMRRDTIFRIASMTKPITAVAAMILVEQCRLRLDEPVERFLPELADRQVLKRLDGEIDDTEPAHRPVTARDLLTFGAGIGQAITAPDSFPIQQAMTAVYGRMGPPQPDLGTPFDEWIRGVGTLPLLHQPGEQWTYNYASDVLGVLIERASGRKFDLFLQEELFGPLGMVDTAFSVPPDQIGRLVTSYSTDPATGRLSTYDPGEQGQWSRPPAMPSGSGGLVSTIDDCLAFARMMLNHGRSPGGRILSRPAVELMTTDQLTPAQKAATSWVPGYFDSHGWGFGLAVRTRRHDLESIGRYGWDGGLGTIWANDPREGLVSVLLTQRAFDSPVLPVVCQDFLTSTYQAIDD